MRFEITATSMVGVKLPDKVYSGRKKNTWSFKYEPDKIYEEEYDAWFIDINSLEELKELVDEMGTIIINGNFDSIEIYNDYRE